jgi:hypothetical protein
MSGRNSIIPAAFGSEQIKFRVPYNMSGEISPPENTAGNFFPVETFNHDRDKPFEMERMQVRLTPINTDESPPELIDALPQTLGRRVRLRIENTSTSSLLTKTPILVDSLISSREGDAGSWEWRVPYVLKFGEAIQVQADILSLAGLVNPANGASISVGAVRVEISFQGSLLQLQPASETR